MKLSKNISVNELINGTELFLITHYLHILNDCTVNIVAVSDTRMR